jgi:hypothetical protein
VRYHRNRYVRHYVRVQRAKSIPGLVALFVMVGSIVPFGLLWLGMLFQEIFKFR